jgi:hypothetical protein
MEDYAAYIVVIWQLEDDVVVDDVKISCMSREWIIVGHANIDIEDALGRN